MKTRNTVVGVFKSMRINQWIKNILVLSIPVLSGEIFTWGGMWRSGLGTLAYSFAASGAYLLNDAWDVERDRIHPTKRTRPIADGTISLAVARCCGVMLTALALAVGAAVRGEFFLVLMVYVVHTLTYSLWIKHVPTVELVAISFGFVLRTVAGGVLVEGSISPWFFATVAAGALLLACGKRIAEYQHGINTRPVLAKYSEAYLAAVLTTSTVAAIWCYTMWVFDGVHNGEVFAQVSILPYVTAILRYTQYAATGGGGSPEEIVVKDRTILTSGVVWLAFIGINFLLHGSV